MPGPDSNGTCDSCNRDFFSGCDCCHICNNTKGLCDCHKRPNEPPTYEERMRDERNAAAAKDYQTVAKRYLIKSLKLIYSLVRLVLQI